MRRGLATAGLTGGLAALAWGGLVERRWYRLARLTVPGVLREPTPRPLRILHVSDVHLVPGQDHRVAFLASLSALDHDLVVATGDLLEVEGTEDAAVEALAPLTAGGRPGLVVLGSHDHYASLPKLPTDYLTRPDRRVHGTPLDTARLIDGLAQAGYRTLGVGPGRGETTTVETPLGRVTAGGMDDPHLLEDLTQLPDIDSLRVADDEAVLRLGLVHAPYQAALDRLLDAGYELLLSGHTHGGQVRVPGVGALVGNCDLPLSRVRGLSRHRGGWLHVSAGLGHSRYAPVRFACRPEATLLELTA